MRHVIFHAYSDIFRFSKIPSKSLVFTEVPVSDIGKATRKKASAFKNITPKVLKASIENCSEVLTKLFNNTILTSDFPDKLKVADVSPIFEKYDPQKSKNYRLSVFCQ